MKKFKLKPAVLAIGLGIYSQMTTAEIFSDRAVIKNDGSQQVTASVNFPTPVSGDLYVATQVGGQFLFLTNGGKKFTPHVTPLASNNKYVGKHALFDFSGAGIAPGRYPLYQVVTKTGTDPLNFNNWVGGLGGLSSFQYSIGLPSSVTKDFNNDGFADNDLNHDGFSDQSGNGQSGNDQSGNSQSGNDQSESNQSGNDQSGNSQSGNSQSGNDQSESNQSGNDQSEHDQSGNEQSSNDGEGNNQPTPTTGTAQGKSLYSANCSNCHGASPRYNKIFRATDPARTRYAINSNKGGMGYLRFLSDADLQAIANYVQRP